MYTRGTNRNDRKYMFPKLFHQYVLETYIYSGGKGTPLYFTTENAWERNTGPRTGRRRQPRAGRDSGPDQDRYGAHPNADRAPGDAGATKREQDQERLRGLGAGSVPGGRLGAGTAFTTGRPSCPDRGGAAGILRIPGSRPAEREGSGPGGSGARVCECVCVCAGALRARGRGWAGTRVGVPARERVWCVRGRVCGGTGVWARVYCVCFRASTCLQGMPCLHPSPVFACSS
jgi:hypothetical protein